MEIGRELDTLIAIKVFKFKNLESNSYILPYSSDISSAWKIVEYMNKNHFRCVLSLFSPSDDKDSWGAYFAKKWPLTDYLSMEIEDGETAEHAICLAALSATKND